MRVTVSWIPGAFKGYSVSQTEQFIVRGLQMWQSVCQIRFGIGPPGSPAQIRFNPYSGNMNGAFAGANPQTGQIIYTTNVNAPADWLPTAMAHEVGHCLGLGHVNRPEALMYTRGSTVRYFDYIEGRAAFHYFGKFTGNHWPWSLTYLGNQIRYNQGKRDQAQAEANKLPDSNPQKKVWLDRRNEAQRALSAVNAQWLRVKREWESIGGIRTPTQAIQAADPSKFISPLTKDKPCLCFSQANPSALREDIDLDKLFKSLPTRGYVPLGGLDVSR